MSRIDSYTPADKIKADTEQHCKQTLDLLSKAKDAGQVIAAVSWLSQQVAGAKYVTIPAADTQPKPKPTKTKEETNPMSQADLIAAAVGKAVAAALQATADTQPEAAVAETKAEAKPEPEPKPTPPTIEAKAVAEAAGELIKAVKAAGLDTIGTGNITPLYLPSLAKMIVISDADFESPAIPEASSVSAWPKTASMLATTRDGKAKGTWLNDETYLAFEVVHKPQS